MAESRRPRAIVHNPRHLAAPATSRAHAVDIRRDRRGSGSAVADSSRSFARTGARRLADGYSTVSCAV